MRSLSCFLAFVSNLDLLKNVISFKHGVCRALKLKLAAAVHRANARYSWRGTKSDIASRNKCYFKNVYKACTGSIASMAVEKGLACYAGIKTRELLQFYAYLFLTEHGQTSAPLTQSGRR